MVAVICPLSIVPVRKEANDRAEQVTQWLFGETAEVLEAQEKWSLLKFHHDGYQGWVDNKQFEPVSGPAIQEQVTVPVRSVEQFMHVNTARGVMILPFGAVLPSWSSGHFKLGAEDLAFAGRTSATITGTSVQRLLALKDQWLNTPYLWGGRSPFGVDCSGLTQMLFLVSGIALPRDASQQAEIGSLVGSVDLATTGGLAFFENAEGRIVHVGIILRRAQDDTCGILHASGRVRVDTLDQQGIFNAEEKRYTHKLRLVRRVM